MDTSRRTPEQILAARQARLDEHHRRQRTARVERAGLAALTGLLASIDRSDGKGIPMGTADLAIAVGESFVEELDRLAADEPLATEPQGVELARTTAALRQAADLAGRLRALLEDDRDDDAGAIAALDVELAALRLQVGGAS